MDDHLSLVIDMKKISTIFKKNVCVHAQVHARRMFMKMIEVGDPALM